MLSLPPCRQRAQCCRRSSRGHVIVSILIRVLYTSQAVFLSLRRGARWCDTDRPPFPTRCPPMSPHENQAVNLFLSGYKKGGTAGLVPRDCPPYQGHCCYFRPSSCLYFFIALFTFCWPFSPGNPKYFAMVPYPTLPGMYISNIFFTVDFESPPL